MANHLHWYIHGSIGARDGQEVDITKPLNLGEINSYSNLCTYPNRDYKYYPIIALPLFLRTDTGFEISSGSLTVGYADTSVGFIGALCTNNNWTPELFNTKTALIAADLRYQARILRLQSQLTTKSRTQIVVCS